MNRQQYLHVRQTLVRLLELGCVFVINENDAIVDDEICWSDNDCFVVFVLYLVNVDVVVLLIDMIGFYIVDLRWDFIVMLVEEVAVIDLVFGVRAGVLGFNWGSGGMVLKLAVVCMVFWFGVRAVIVWVDWLGVVVDALVGVWGVGTIFYLYDRRFLVCKLWIVFVLLVEGVVVVDDGACWVLVEWGMSLFFVGVRAVVGSFELGDMVDVRTIDGSVFARGLVLVDVETLRAVFGCYMIDLFEGVVVEVVYRDDLVVVLM